MDVYRQASEIVKLVMEGKGTAKSLCLRKEMQKKRQTYAVVCETIRHYDLLGDILEQSEFFKYYPRANRDYAFCMVYDAVIGKGLNTNSDTTAQAVQKSVAYLRDAYWSVKKHHIILPRIDELTEKETDGSFCAKQSLLQLPRYARINTLKIDPKVLIEKLKFSTAKRPRDDEQEEDTATSGQTSRRNGKRATLRLPSFKEDAIIPHLIVFPSGTDLHAHPAVRRGQLILQDRASCLPACVLLGTVPVDVTCDKKGDRAKLEYIIDACAAPGNKTTHLAALGAPDIKIMAVERDETRADLLNRRVQSLGAGEYINTVNMDFFNMCSDDRNAAEGILLDPSCSSSGMVSRVDVTSRMHGAQNFAEEKVEESEAEAEFDDGTQENGKEKGNSRVEGLARLQRKLLTHSLLSFDVCRTVVYSTCSIHEEENENVVRQVLSDDRVKARGWSLSNIMPKLWKTRGIQKEDDTIPLTHTIRCDSAKDLTNGFFVARFDRSI